MTPHHTHSVRVRRFLTPLLALSVALLVVMAGVLGWLSRENTLPPGVKYVPPHVENGVIVPGRGAQP